MKGTVTVAACAIVLASSGCGRSASDGERAAPAATGEGAHSATGLLQESADALRAVESVRYEFEFGDAQSPAGWMSGVVTMQKQSRLEDAWVLVRGKVHAQPTYGVTERVFAFASDGGSAWAQESADGPVLSAPVGQGSNQLSATAVYAVLPEFVEQDPYWQELSASTTELLPPKRVEGRLAERVRVTYRLGGDFAAETTWWIDAQDRLPRRGVWRAPFAGPGGLVLTIRNVQPGVSLSREELAPPSPPQERPVQIVARGEKIAPWSLESSTGGRIRSQDLEGKTVVLDFWNTWCPVCRGLAPKTRALAQEFTGMPVQFLGVNILETGDPLQYWQDSDYSYPTLLAGDELGTSLDLPWQPGVAVIDRHGVLRHRQLGASGDRTARLREAILESLQQ